MRWASQLQDDSCVLSLILSLPKEVVNEQVDLYKQRGETKATAVAVPATKIRLGPHSKYTTRMVVAQRFNVYCLKNGIAVDEKLPMAQ